MTTYRIEVYKEEDNGDEATWLAEDWCYMVMRDTDADIVCICATEEEAQHILRLLEKEPYVATTVTD